jgi:hypothetical protein
MVQEFLPAVRQLVARKLRAQGFSQNRTSAMLGITQASVSLYLSSEIAKVYSVFSQFGVSREEADTYSALLAEDSKRSAVDAVSTLNTIWTSLLGRGSVCARHRRQYPSLADCDLCIKEYGQGRSGSSEAVADVADAVRNLESSFTFASVMPEVSVNIACVAGDASSLSNVVAVPGRMVKVKGRARAMLPPEPGASRHLASVLLSVKKVMPGVRACINLRYDSEMGRVLRRLRLKAIEIGDYAVSGAKDPTVDALVRRLGTVRPPFDAVIDTGGNGIEPSLYLFGKSAREVAVLALQVSRFYSAR